MQNSDDADDNYVICDDCGAHFPDNDEGNYMHPQIKRPSSDFAVKVTGIDSWKSVANAMPPFSLKRTPRVWPQRRLSVL
jgi:hypothetical protein